MISLRLMARKLFYSLSVSSLVPFCRTASKVQAAGSIVCVNGSPSKNNGKFEHGGKKHLKVVFHPYPGLVLLKLFPSIHPCTLPLRGHAPLVN